MTLEDLMRRTSAGLDASGEFDRIISENIMTDYFTGERVILVSAETITDETTRLSEEIFVMIKESEATEASVDRRVEDTLTKFGERITSR